MKNFICLLLGIALIISCKNKASQTQLDNFEAELSKEGILWQSNDKGTYSSKKIEFFFRKDSTALAVWDNNYQNPEIGKWAFDKTTSHLQIAWANSKQISVNVKSITDDFSDITFSDAIYRMYGKKVLRLKDIAQKSKAAYSH